MMLDQARSIMDRITSAAPDADPKAVGQLWKSLHTSLKKAPCDQMRLARYIAERNVEGVKGLFEVIAKAPPPVPRGSMYASSTPTNPGESSNPARPASQPMISVKAEKPTAQQLKTALAAFKKRLKTTKLDQESRLGRSPLTGGSRGTIAILPPNPYLYPKIYWEELERQGQIRNTGGGFYELVEKAKPIKGDSPAETIAEPAAEADAAEPSETSDEHAAAE